MDTCECCKLVMKRDNVTGFLKRVVGIDVKAEGQRTTLGCAQFALFNANMTHLEKEIVGKPGRRKTVTTSIITSKFGYKLIVHLLSFAQEKEEDLGGLRQ